MRHVDLFTAFLKDTVNLNQTRIDDLESNIDALKGFVRQAVWEPKIRGFEEQGSWAHDTIIKPVDGDEFDADLLVMVAPVAGWSAAEYVKSLGKLFTQSGTYKEKAKVWDYCVTITYAGERKVDLAPCVMDRNYQGNLEVCNRLKDAFERSEPVEYTAWLKDRNTYSGANSFRKVTRLLKYLRDIKGTFTCPSVLLTTLLGMQINWWDKGSHGFSDVPTTLKTVMERLDNWLQMQPLKPRIQNPKLASEDFAAGLTQEQYANFRNFIHKYRGWICEAYDEGDRVKSIKAWQRVFGEDFARGEAVSPTRASVVEQAAARAALLNSASAIGDLVERVRYIGLSALPTMFNRQPHMREPPWRKAEHISHNLQVMATLHPSRNANPERVVRSGEILKPRGGLWFDVSTSEGLPVPNDFAVHWRITNTGSLAKIKGAERGDFYVPMTGSRRWEELQFRGVHLAEAFVVQRSSNVLVGQSQPFHVVIE